MDDRRSRIATALARIRPRGATALYDAVIEALPLAQTGRHRKKALVVISDGNDTNSRATIRELKALDPRIRSPGLRDRHRHRDTPRSERDGSRPPIASSRAAGDRGCRSRCRFRLRRPAAARPAPPPPTAARTRRQPIRTPPVGRYGSRLDDRVNVAALRDITDDSGGRTEIVRTGARPRSGHGEHRRRTEQAVLPGIRVAERTRRPAGTRSASTSATADTSCARAAGMSQRQ